MSKELEALEELKETCDLFDNGHQWDKTFSKLFDEDIAIIESALQDYEQIKKLFEEYNIEFNLVNMRHALFTFAQLKGEYGANWDNYNKKIKALEIIKEKRVDADLFLTRRFILTNNNPKNFTEKEYCDDYNYFFARKTGVKLTQEEYKLLKEVLL